MLDHAEGDEDTMNAKFKQIVYEIMDKLMVFGLSALVLFMFGSVFYQAFHLHQTWAIALVVFVPPIVAFLAWSIVYVGGKGERE